MIALDGPGQGSTVRDKGLHFRPDREGGIDAVMTVSTQDRWAVRNGRGADDCGEHCHEGALAGWHQRAFDWLDSVLAG